MFALTSLVLGTVVTFSGTTVDALAKTLADATKSNAIIVTSTVHTFDKKFSFDAASADSMSQAVRTNTGLVMTPGVQPYFSDQSFVPSHFTPLQTGQPAPLQPGQKFTSKVLTAGKVSFTTDGSQPYALGSLADISWSKPLKIDPLLQDLEVSATVNEMSEHDFLAAVAKAAGAVLISNDNGNSLTYDPDQLRIRVVNTLQKIEPSNPRQLPDARRTFYIATVNALDSDSLMVVFQNPGTTQRIDVAPNSDFATASVAYIKDLESLQAQSDPAAADEAESRPRRANPGKANGGDILSRIDNRATVHLRLNGQGTILLSVPVINGKTSSYIEL